jgi:hypothetical protein
MAFTTESISIASDGAPSIAFNFDGDTCRAELAGAKLYAEVRTSGVDADLRLTDHDGEVLADIVVNQRAHRDLTENVIDVASALLWSRWRWVQASSKQPK